MSFEHLEKIVSRIIYDLELVNETPLHIGSGEEEGITRNFIRVKINDKEYAVIPESALKGALRKEATRIAKSIVSNKEIIEKHIIMKEIETEEKPNDKEIYEHEKECPICRLFGGTFFAGKIIIHTAISTEPLSTEDVNIKTGILIDRKTGTVEEHHIHRLLSVRPGKMFRTRIIVNNPNENEKQIIEALIANLQHIGIILGGRKTVGYGQFKVQIRKVDGIPYQNIL